MFATDRPASTLEPYINPPHHLVCLSSELPSLLLSQHFRCAGDPHQFALVPGRWPYASVLEMDVALGCFSPVSSPHFPARKVVHVHILSTL